MILITILICYVAAAVLYMALNHKKDPIAAVADNLHHSSVATAQLRAAQLPTAQLPSAQQPSAALTAKTSRYRIQKPLLAAGELLFYEALKQASAGAHEIFVKIRIADILQAEDANSNEWRAAVSGIANHYFDFVICNKASLAVIALIALTDPAAADADRDRRDKLIRGACKNAKIPFIVIKTKAHYNVEQLKTLIALF